jgi:GNAT superfamily N-acetyltransferase
VTSQLLIDHALVRRFEMAGAADLTAMLESSRATGHYPDAVAQPIADGVAVWFSPGNVVNGAFGLGMDAPVTESDVDALVAFFRARGEAPSIDVCPYADSSLISLLSARGFTPAGFETVLCQSLPLADADDRARPSASERVAVRMAHTPEDRETWAQLEARGFMDEKVDDGGRVLARAIAARDDAMHFIGYLDGEPAGTGMLTIRDGWASLNGDATLPSMRGHGVQSAILAERLRVASSSGCDLAWIEATPGGVSERNQQRAGFRIAYTRTSLKLL